MVTHTLSTGEVVVLTGVTARQLDYWSRLGMFEMFGLPRHVGSGGRRRYPYACLDTIAVLVRAAAIGLGTDRLKDLAVAIRSDLPWVAFLAADPDAGLEDRFLACDTDGLTRLLSSKPAVTVFHTNRGYLPTS